MSHGTHLERHNSKSGMLRLPGGWPPGSGSSSIGFRTLAMWGFFGVVLVGVSYYDAMNDMDDTVPHTKKQGVPDTVVRVLPSGAWLMADGSVVQPSGNRS